MAPPRPLLPGAGGAGAGPVRRVLLQFFCSTRPTRPTRFFNSHPASASLSTTATAAAFRGRLSYKQLSSPTFSFQRSSKSKPTTLRQALSSSSSSYSTVVVHSRPRSRVRRTISFLIIASTSFLIGGYYALHFPPVLHPWIMGSTIPTDAETLTLYNPPDDFSREIDEHIRNSALAKSLRADPSWRESRPHLKIPDAIKQHNLTAGTLAIPGGLTVPPYYFNKTDGSEMVQIFYVGTDVSGHPGIVHGGFVATIMDEGLARCAFPAMPNKVGVTANLKIDYRRPTMAGQFLVLRAKTTKVEGRKAWSEGWLESLDATPAEGEQPERLVEASALFVEPKHAKVMKSLYKAASD